MLNKALRILGAVVIIGGAASVCEGAAARRLNPNARISSTSAKLLGKPRSKLSARQKNIVDCDPEPTIVSGATFLTYDTDVVTVTGFDSGPAFLADGAVLVGIGTINRDNALAAELPFYQSISEFLINPAGVELGVVKANFIETPQTDDTPGVFATPEDYTLLDQDGLEGYETHRWLFDYLDGVADDTIASYLHTAVDPFTGEEGFLYFSDGSVAVGDEVQTSRVEGFIVPEPGSLGLLSIGAIALLRRRVR